MTNDYLEKQLSEAMGDAAPEGDARQDPEPQPEVKPEVAVAAPVRRKSTSKKTLATPPLVAGPAASEPVQVSYEELKLLAKIEALQELLREGVTLNKAVRADIVKAKIDAPPEERVPFTVNLPVQASNIRLDGLEYYHGHTYNIRASQLSTFRDIQQNAWRHDDQVRGYRTHPDGFVTAGMTINKDGQVQSRPIY